MFQIIFPTKMLIVKENTIETFQLRFLTLDKFINTLVGEKPIWDKKEGLLNASIQITICIFGLILQLTSPACPAIAKSTHVMVTLCRAKIQLHTLKPKRQDI